MVSFNITEGNPGALSFLIEAYEFNPLYAEGCFERMQQNEITGSKLYMLWNDCCNRNTEWALTIMRNHPIYAIKEHIDYENGRGIPFPEATKYAPDRSPIKFSW